MSDKQSTTAALQPVIGGFNRPPGFQYNFSNHARVRLSPGEVTIVFSYTDESPAGPLLTEITSVTLTPTHTRKLLLTLSEMLKVHEEKFGGILPEPTSSLDSAELTRRIEEAIKSELSKK
jgi:hypothetical protein